MNRQLIGPLSHRATSASVLALLVLVGLGVVFFSQASYTNEVSYADVLRFLLLAACIPQALLIVVLYRIAPRGLFFLGAVVTLSSWLFVLELAVRVLAA
jgi:hypothetical protein